MKEEKESHDRAERDGDHQDAGFGRWKWQIGIHDLASGYRAMSARSLNSRIAGRAEWEQQKNGNEAYVGNVTQPGTIRLRDRYGAGWEAGRVSLFRNK